MNDRISLWTGETPLVLASASRIRLALIDSVGIAVEVHPAAIDERALEAELGDSDPVTAARTLAVAKAVSVSAQMAGRYVLGADQTLAVAGRVLHKPRDRQQAAEHLAFLSGRDHQLHSALALAINGRVVWRHVETATLTVRPLSPGFIHAYLEAAGDAILSSVGCYQVEDLGMHLFSRIGADHTTIMGLPLLPLLSQLRNMGLVHA